MKRDLKKWLKGNSVQALLELTEEEIQDYSEEEIIESLMDISSIEYENTLQFIWCEAQKQFLKDILDDIDESMDKLFRGKNQVKGDKAQLVAYEASVKQWLYNKYHYLKRKNGS